MTEYLSIVNEKDEEIGKATYEDASRDKLTRRIVHVLIFNDEDKMVLQMRSRFKPFCPNHWSTAVGGHVHFGETYEEGALREMDEELGIQRDLEFLGKYSYSDGKGLSMFLSIFKTVFSGPYEVNPEEVERVEYFSLDEIQKMIENGDKFHPELLFLLKKIYSISTN